MIFIKKVTEKAIFNSFIVSYFLTILALIFVNSDINMMEFIKCHMLVTAGVACFVLVTKLILEVVLLIKQLLEKLKIFLSNKIKEIDFIKKINISK